MRKLKWHRLTDGYTAGQPGEKYVITRPDRQYRVRLWNDGGYRLLGVTMLLREAQEIAQAHAEGRTP